MNPKRVTFLQSLFSNSVWEVLSDCPEHCMIVTADELLGLKTMQK